MALAERIISADEHIVEPPSFWSKWLPRHASVHDLDALPRLSGTSLVVNGEVMRTFELFPDLAARNDRMLSASDFEGRLVVTASSGTICPIDQIKHYCSTGDCTPCV